MVGPFIFPGLPDHLRINFEGLSIPSEAISQQKKGLYYFHMSRFVLQFELENNDPTTPYLLEFIRIIKEGNDPLAKHLT